MSETAAAEEADAAVMPYKLLTTVDDDSGIGEKEDEEDAKWFANFNEEALA